ncbi:hypothetical protein ES703_79145 [subsurface metagenome]
MARYKKYEHLPWWENCLNDDTLTPTQKEVLNLDYYCKKFGTKLSHKQAADMLDCGRHTVYTARRRLEELLLRITEPAKGSFLVGYPIEYENEAEWLAALRAQGIDPRRFKMKRKSSRETPPLGGVSLSKVQKEAGKKPAGESISGAHPPNPLTTCGSGGMVEATATRKAKDGFMRELVYKDSLRKLLDVGHSEDRAKNLAQIKTDQYIAKRATRLKSTEEKSIQTVAKGDDVK